MIRFDGVKNPVRRQFLEDGVLRQTNPELDIDLTFAEYRKTSTTFAVRMGEPFEVDTLEGLHSGKAGDWLAVGQAGEMYPIDAAVFASTYEPVE